MSATHEHLSEERDDVGLFFAKSTACGIMRDYRWVPMADIDIPQAEADALIAMEKERVHDKEWLFTAAGERLAIPLASLDKREQFMLDVSRGQIKLTKAMFQNRARQAVVLMRLDLDGPPHRNPDGAEVPCPHLHIPRRLW